MDWEGYSGSLQHEDYETLALSQLQPDGTSLEVPFDEDLEHHRHKRIRLDDQSQNLFIHNPPSPEDFHPTAHVDPLTTPTQPVLSSNSTTEPYLDDSIRLSTLGVDTSASYVPDALTESHSLSEQDGEKASCLLFMLCDSLPFIGQISDNEGQMDIERPEQFDFCFGMVIINGKCYFQLSANLVISDHHPISLEA